MIFWIFNDFVKPFNDDLIKEAIWTRWPVAFGPHVLPALMILQS